MVPYFLVLGILAAYGFHRYWLVYCYAKYRANVPGKPDEPADWPKVTIQLPIYNERYVVERLVEAISRIDYPSDLETLYHLNAGTVMAFDLITQWMQKIVNYHEGKPYTQHVPFERLFPADKVQFAQ